MAAQPDRPRRPNRPRGRPRHGGGARHRRRPPARQPGEEPRHRAGDRRRQQHGRDRPPLRHRTVPGGRHPRLPRRRRHQWAGDRAVPGAQPGDRRARDPARADDGGGRRGAAQADRRPHRRTVLPRHRPRRPAPHLPGDRPAGEDAAQGQALRALSRGLPAARLERARLLAAAACLLRPVSDRRAMSFAAPHLLWLALVAPLAIGLAALLWRRRLAADAAWAARALWDRLLPTYRPARLALSVALLGLALLGAALALARPRWGGGLEKVERRGVDVAFLLDSSLSMAAPDVAPSRLF